MKSPPPPPRGLPAAGGTTLVGGTPWAVSPPSSSRETPAVPGMPVVADAAGRSAGRARRAAVADEGAEPGRFEELVRRSPPLTLSLSLHIVVLLALAVWIVQPRREAKLVLDLSFASPEVAEAPQPGVLVVPQPVTEPEPKADTSDEPPVEEPTSAPPNNESSSAPGPAVAKAAVPVVAALLDGREEGRRAALVQAFGGSDATEAAVARALAWLAKQQQKDGLWSLQGPYVDGGSQENRLAATAMALLAFQGAGTTPGAGKHRSVVKRGWEALVRKQLADGHFEFMPPIPSLHTLYSHAQATIAVCELYGMTKDEAHKKPAQLALDYALAAQGGNGGWKYQPGQDGDMSVTGWYMMALKSGQMAGLDVPAECFERLESFLESVAVQDGARYRYAADVPGRQPAQISDAISAEGLLSRQYLGWRPGNPRLLVGLEVLLAAKPFDWENDKDVYAWYYITQVAHHAGGDARVRWNDRMVEVLPAMQVSTGPHMGSWDPSGDEWGHIGGRLFTTCFCTYMLEVYYRHLPLYADEAMPAGVTIR